VLTVVRMSMSESQRRPSISVRLDARTIARLSREAEADRRPVSNLIRNLIDDGLRERERQAARGNANG
jgi:predicted transcriptional regulator